MKGLVTRACTALYRRAVPSGWQKRIWAVREVYRILAREYGYFRSVVTETCADAHGRPIPWYTYPAIEYLSQLDFREKRVFEYGSGQSTYFWASEARTVCSVEHNEKWHEKVSAGAPANCTVLFRANPEQYCRAIDDLPQAFDVIVIDGPLKGRLDCAQRVVERLAPGGIIILDNSNWLPRTATFLRDQGYLQVDFTGFGPAGVWTWTTSVYFDRNCRLEPKRGLQPIGGLGSIRLEPEESALAA
jgi:hypothetical protein